ncbi:hypothetical protein EV10_0123 [Prochlorococcus marinus str. SS51]|nr:hypothetical protein EV04_1414 [Prochlorococcus marinus str. LG]KGG22983.1 hypothetical protein EV09_1725 [Prochlorococcus marinus str. SS35]KGG34087.1 hypothetical protein EV10_0123 [Prochlorococcus marinus str. SS51]
MFFHLIHCCLNDLNRLSKITLFKSFRKVLFKKAVIPTLYQSL